MSRTQSARLLAIGTPLGDDVLLLRAIAGTEELGRPFHYDLDLLSENDAIPFDEIVGQNCTVRIERPDGQTRFINGLISRFVQTESRGHLASYRATLVPWLWLLTRTADCRILPPNKTVPEIVEHVLRQHGLTDFRTSGLSGDYKQREYCVQYRETDFNFVSRLLEQEGIYYYFEHENGKHTLVLCDAPGAHNPAPGYAQIPYDPRADAGPRRERISEWTIEKDVQPTLFSHTDFDPLLPNNGLYTTSRVNRSHAASGFEVFDYPGEYVDFNDGERLARVRLEEFQARHEVLRGRTDARGLAAGCTFTLTDHPREDQRREYLVTAAHLHAESDEFDADPHRGAGAREFFRVSFSAIPKTQAFRPARLTPKPVISGPQTAIVAGSSAKEIVVDEHARVKVKFHWDRYSRGDDESSCFIRVAQVWAGKKWGALFIPRIGQEVIVEFLEGDPDRPIITGRVYNGECKPPYDLPAHKTVSTIKSDSSEGSGGCNEIRFTDEKDKEQILIQARRRMDVRVRANHYETTGGNREIRVGHDDKGDLNALVHRDVNAQIKGGTFGAVEKKLNITIKDDVVEDYQKNQTTVVKERLTLNAKELVAETSDAVSLKSGKVVAQGGQSLHLKAGAVHIEGTQAIHLKSGGNFVVIDSAGVTINGMMVKINSGGSAQAAEAPLQAQEPTIEDPLEAAAATTAVPGQRSTGRGGGRSTSPRTRTSRTVPLRRAPEPPPPPVPGVIGWGNVGDQPAVDQIELVEVVEVTGPAGSATPTAPCETRRQYVNLPRTVSGSEHKENGRIVYLKAKVRWKTGDPSRSLAGQSVRFYATPDGSNKDPARLHSSLRAGFGGPNRGMNKTVQTNAEGWTDPVPFHVSRYGGDKFQVFATLMAEDSGGLAAGEYEVWRKVTFEVDAMQRPDGTDYMDVAGGVINQFVAAHAAAFTEAVQVGRNSSPAHRRLLSFSDLNGFHTGCADASGTQYIHLMYVDTVLTGRTEENRARFTGITVPVGTTPVPLSLDALQATFLPGATGWVVSATWTDPATGRSGAIPAANFTSPVAAGTYARHRNQGGDFDRYDFTVRLDGTGAPAGARVTINLRYKSQHYLSGVQIGQTTTVAMRFRELRANAGTGFNLANATLQTSIHESSHAFGLASRQRPDGSNNPDFTTDGGGHCTHTATCVMTPALHQHTAFCDFCSDNLRARNLERIAVRPGDAMA